MARPLKTETKKVILDNVDPEYGEGYVMVKTSFRGDMLDKIAEFHQQNSAEKPSILASLLIDDWNLENENNEKLKINHTNVAQNLEGSDLVKIITESGINESMKGIQGKKKSETGLEQK